MKKMRIIGLLLLPIFLFLCMADYSASAEAEDPDRRLPSLPEGYSYYGENYTDENNNLYFYISRPDGPFGLSEGYWIDENGCKVEEAVTAEEPALPAETAESADSLPAAYDGRDYGLVTAVESQISGTCWAHATIAALESNAIIQGLGDNTLNLNEYHTVWNSLNGYYEGSTDSRNDGYVAADLTKMMSNGGSASGAGRAFQNFSGLVTEDTIPLTSTGVGSLITEMGNTFTFENKLTREITGMQIFSVSVRNREAVKQAIMTYGGMYFSYSSYGKGYSHYSSTGEKITTYFTKGITGSSDGGHAVEIIGWDDNFSVDNFGQAQKPSEPGAWLLKNSWGKGWGNSGGYFWMSYEETSYYGCYVIRAMAEEEFQHPYFYDGAGYGKSISCSAAANVFTADESVYLTKFSAGRTFSDNYTLSVYLLNDDYQSPTDGSLLYTQTGKGHGESYVDITGTVELQKGDRFSLVLEGPTYAAVEGASSTSRKYTSASGESYYYTTQWIDSSEAGNNNVCIRAIGREHEEKDSYRVKFSCSGKNELIAYSKNGKVTLPETEGYTWVLSYNGKTFNGTGVDRDMTVDAHCYPNAGTPSKKSSCITEYRCIYCNTEVRAAEDCHTMETSMQAASTHNAGYTYSVCTKCGMETRKDLIFMDLSDHGELSGGLVWQYIDGNLAVDGQGDMPWYDAGTDTPWAEYLPNIKAVYINRGVTSVGGYAFEGSAVEKIHLAENVSYIDCNAFASSHKLTALSLPDTLLYLYEYAFYDCPSLSSLDLGDGLEEIDYNAFGGCTSLTEITLPGSLDYLDYYVFDGCTGLKKLTFEDGITDLDYSVCTSGQIALDSLSLPSTLKYLSSSFFAGFSGVQTLSLPQESANFKLVDGVLYSANEKKLCYYPAGKTEEAFTLPAGVTSVWGYAFSGNTHLKRLDMSSSEVTSLASYTLRNCPALTNLMLPGKLSRLSASALCGVDGIRSLWLPFNVTSIPYTFFVRSDPSVPAPALYSDSALTAASMLASEHKDISYTYGHAKHSYLTLLSGSIADCKTDSDRVMGCACGVYQGFSGEHCYEWVIDQAATCGKVGYKHKQCVICYDVTASRTEIPATGNHSYINRLLEKALKTPADCTHAAVYYPSCSVCGTLNTNTTFSYSIPLGHDFTGALVCNGDGTHSFKCTRCESCGNVTGCTQVLTARTHGANCVTCGEDSYTCSVCGGVVNLPNDLKGEHTIQSGSCIYCSTHCDCACHATGTKLSGWKFKLFFYKIFKTHTICDCGNKHY